MVQQLLLVPLCRLHVVLTEIGEVSLEYVLGFLDAGVEVVVLDWVESKEIFIELSEWKDFPKERIVWRVTEAQLESVESILDWKFTVVCNSEKLLDVISPDRFSLFDPSWIDSKSLINQKLNHFDAYVCSAIVSGKLHIAHCITAFAVSDRSDGLIPTVVADLNGVALGLVYSNKESLFAAIDQGKGIYWSRKRGLWEKGLTSGATQDLFKVDLDCDSDCIRFLVVQKGSGFCHLERRSCWDQDSGLGALL